MSTDSQEKFNKQSCLNYFEFDQEYYIMRRRSWYDSKGQGSALCISIPMKKLNYKLYNCDLFLKIQQFCRLLFRVTKNKFKRTKFRLGFLFIVSILRKKILISSFETRQKISDPLKAHMTIYIAMVFRLITKMRKKKFFIRTIIQNF